MADFDSNNIITSNPRLDMAWNLIEQTGCSLFLTGKAGTGKTTFLRRLVDESAKKLVVVAPTGIAAINAGGVTIHSFFQLVHGLCVPETLRANKNIYKISANKKALIKSLDLLIIDEISMVRADLLDGIDFMLRRLRGNQHPFGGVQLLLIGDLQQLSPVVSGEEEELLSQYYPSPYFFDSNALKKIDLKTIELDQVYRQTDCRFLDMLNDIRTGSPSASTINELNRRYKPDFIPPENSHYIHLTTHRNKAKELNMRQLASLQSESTVFHATVNGKFPEKGTPAEIDLELKEGAQVMFIKNDTSEQKRYYNGMMGHVAEIADDSVTVISPEVPDPIVVRPEMWVSNRYELQEDSGEIKQITEGTFSQIPLQLAWAITVHKSQGLTFSHAIIDVSHSFAHGQTYVALSRCRTLEGMVLDAPLSLTSVLSDNRVERFTQQCKASALVPDMLRDMKNEYASSLLDHLFSLSELRNSYEDFYRLASEHLGLTYPEYVEKLREADKTLTSLYEMGRKFSAIYRSMPEGFSEGIPTPELAGRIKNAGNYYIDKLQTIIDLVKEGIPIVIQMKKSKSSIFSILLMLRNAFNETTGMLKYLSANDFSISGYLKHQSEIRTTALEVPFQRETSPVTDAPKPASASEPESEDSDQSLKIIPKAAVIKREKSDTKICNGLYLSDLTNPDLYNHLTEWRRELSARLEVPAFTITSNRTLAFISEMVPRSKEEMLAVPGIAEKSYNRHGADILECIARFLESDENQATVAPHSEENKTHRMSALHEKLSEGAR